MAQQEITQDVAHDLIRILCKGSNDEAEFTKFMNLMLPQVKDTSYYWNSYHAVMSSSKILAAMGIHGSDLEKALQEIGDFISNQIEDEAPKNEKPLPDNVTPLKH